MIDISTGKRVGEFVVEEEISRQPLSAVYRAIQTSVQRNVALKVFQIDAAAAQRASFVRRFMREAQVIATLEHIRLVPVYDYGIINDHSVYVVMRLLHHSVAKQLAAGPVPYVDAIDIGLQVASGLAYAHGRGVLHGNLQPDNLLLDEFGNTYLSDFSLSRLGNLFSEDAASAGPLPPSSYDAPETTSDLSKSEKADQYSLAAVLYHMLTGQPYNPTAVAATARAIPAAPGEVEAIILRALSADPEQRFPSVEALSTALSTASGQSISISTELRLRALKPATVKTRALRGLLLLPILALLLVALFALATTRSGVRRPAVVPGERGGMADALPSDGEIAQARAVIGERGFIGFLACTTETQTGQERARHIREAAESYGLPVKVYDSGMDRYKQLTQLERAQLDGASALIICALGSSVLNNSLASLQQTQIPLVFTSPYQPGYGGVMLDTNEHGLGEKAGAYAAQLLNDEHGGTGSVVLLTYPDNTTMIQRLKGITAQLTALAPKATVLGPYPATTPDLAARSIATLLKQGQHIDVIVTVTDAAAKGAVTALAEAMIPTNAVSIVSINGEAQALEMIRNQRYLRASVDVDQATWGKLAVGAIIKLLAGDTVPETLSYAPGALMTFETLTAQATPEATAAS